MRFSFMKIFVQGFMAKNVVKYLLKQKFSRKSILKPHIKHYIIAPDKMCSVL